VTTFEGSPRYYDVSMGNETYSPQLKPAKLYWWTREGLMVLTIRSAWRYWITGRELRGAGDNATFFHDATVDHRGRPYERLTRARWRRVLRRWVLLGWPLTLALVTGAAGIARDMGPAPAWSRLPWGGALVAYLAALAIVASVWGGRRLARWWPERVVRRELVRPAAEVLVRLSGVRLSRRKAMALIALPPGFTSAPEPGAAPRAVRVYMPAAIPLSDTRKAEYTRELGQRLGLPHARGDWTIATERAYVDLTPAPLPPSDVDLSTVRAEVEAAPLERPVIGVANGGKVISMDFDNDSPHTLGSAGSGAGKSTLYRWVAMQRMRHGAGAIFLDFKKWSHIRWLRGFGPDRVLYFHRIPEIHDALVAVMDEIERRKDIDDEDVLALLRTLDIYVEEINTLMGMLRDYWRAYVAQQKSTARAAVWAAKRSEDPQEMAEAEELLATANGLSLMSPAIQALRHGVNLGREFRVHFHFIGQSMSASAAGGRDTRESFRTRMLARWDAKTWKMLAEGVPFIVCPAGPTGIWAHVHGSEVEIVRVPWVSPEQAREFVLGGTCPALGHVLDRDIGGTLGGTSGQDMSRTSVSVLSTLSDVLGQLPPRRDGTRMSLKALRRAAERRDETGFPEPIQRGDAGQAHLYDVTDVREWFAEREGPGQIGA
jgi:hypothetical protein